MIEPYWTSDCGRAIVYVGDCRKILPQLQQEQFHAVVTDPPYELTSDTSTKRSAFPGRYSGTNGEKRGFMGQKWDGTGVAFDPITWSAVLRVAKPGAHLLSFGGTRTYHRMVCAIEDSEWIVREMIMWCYSQGFPKSLDISKQIDKMHGAERQVVGKSDSGLGAGQFTKQSGLDSGYGHGVEYDVTVPATEDAKIWSGWGTSLKPSVEPICVARKPMETDTARNMLEHGCGGLNIDGCRVGTEQVGWGGANGFTNTHEASKQVVGRWPSNLAHDGSEEVVDLFPQSSSTRQEVTSKPGVVYGNDKGLPSHTGVYGFNDNGSVARMFYTAKADENDRPHGKDSTVHPTVKPQSLMVWLVRLVCPRGGIILDPFMGSGSTGVAALTEGMKFVGIEQSKDYADIAVGRLKLALQTAPTMVELVTRAAVNTEEDTPPPAKKLRLK